LRKVANRQTETNRQTNNDDYITSLVEVKIKRTTAPEATVGTSLVGLYYIYASKCFAVI